jgi:hypothetical protein
VTDRPEGLDNNLGPGCRAIPGRIDLGQCARAADVLAIIIKRREEGLVLAPSRAGRWSPIDIIVRWWRNWVRRIPAWPNRPAPRIGRCR